MGRSTGGALALSSAALVLALSLGGCGVAVRLGPPASPDPDAATTQFCADFTAAGGDAATVGPLPLSERKEGLSEEVRSRLAAMGDLEPPSAIAVTWRTWKDYFDDVAAALDSQPDGSMLADDDLIQTGIDLYPQSRLIRNFYLTTCE